jgi:diguanylate cyclase (GGDEF)-like protein
VTEITAVAVVAALLTVEPTSSAAIGRLALVLGLGVLFAELASAGTRLSHFLTTSSGSLDNSSVWVMAAVLLAPAGHAAAMVAVVQLYYEMRGRKKPKKFKAIYTTATIVLAALAASGIIAGVTAGLHFLPRGPGFAVGVVLAVVGFQAVNQGLVAVVAHLMDPERSWKQLVPDRHEHFLETVFLLIGVLTAECIRVEPWLSPSVLAVIALVHRTTLFSQLQEAASTDDKTTLLNAAGWRARATAEVEQSRRTRTSVALMLIDLDHFKRINDTYGHLAGDRALVAVGKCLRDELRSVDAVGRFGGEEFIVLLTGIDRPGAEAIAERIRTAITTAASTDHMVVTASVGLAHATDPDVDLDVLIEAADSALYVAKKAGRDRISSRSHVA